MYVGEVEVHEYEAEDKEIAPDAGGPSKASLLVHAYSGLRFANLVRDFVENLINEENTIDKCGHRYQQHEEEHEFSTIVSVIFWDDFVHHEESAVE